MKKATLILLLCAAAGCGSGGPSYDVALQTWKTEVEVLKAKEAEVNAAAEIHIDEMLALNQSNATEQALNEKREARKQRVKQLRAEIEAQKAKVDKAKRIMDEAEKRR